MDIQSLGIVNFWVFVTAGIILNITPGQDTIYIVTRSVAEGRISGIASALGVSTGGVIHLALATLGLSAIITTSPAAFAAVKLLGATYLVYLGVDMLLPPTVDRHLFERRNASQRGHDNISARHSHESPKPEGCNVLSGLSAPVYRR